MARSAARPKPGRPPHPPPSAGYRSPVGVDDTAPAAVDVGLRHRTDHLLGRPRHRVEQVVGFTARSDAAGGARRDHEHHHRRGIPGPQIDGLDDGIRGGRIRESGAQCVGHGGHPSERRTAHQDDATQAASHRSATIRSEPRVSSAAHAGAARSPDPRRRSARSASDSPGATRHAGGLQDGRRGRHPRRHGPFVVQQHRDGRVTPAIASRSATTMSSRRYRASATISSRSRHDVDAAGGHNARRRAAASGCGSARSSSTARAIPNRSGRSSSRARTSHGDVVRAGDERRPNSDPLAPETSVRSPASIASSSTAGPDPRRPVVINGRVLTRSARRARRTTAVHWPAGRRRRTRTDRRQHDQRRALRRARAAWSSGSATSAITRSRTSPGSPSFPGTTNPPASGRGRRCSPRRRAAAHRQRHRGQAPGFARPTEISHRHRGKPARAPANSAGYQLGVHVTSCDMTGIRRIPPNSRDNGRGGHRRTVGYQSAPRCGGRRDDAGRWGDACPVGPTRRIRRRSPESAGNVTRGRRPPFTAISPRHQLPQPAARPSPVSQQGPGTDAGWSWAPRPARCDTRHRPWTPRLVRARTARSCWRSAAAPAPRRWPWRRTNPIIGRHRRGGLPRGLASCSRRSTGRHVTNIRPGPRRRRRRPGTHVRYRRR